MPKAKAVLDPKPALVDSIGALEADPDVIAGKPKIARLEALRKELRGFYEDTGAAVTATVTGEEYICTVGARGFQTEVDLPTLEKEIGRKRFFSIATVTLKAAKPLLSAIAASRIFTQTQTGPRTLHVSGKAS